MDKNITPLFTSHYTFGRSTLTLEKPEEINDNKPISILSLAKKYELDKVFLAESNFSGFVEAYKNFKDNKIQLIFGLKLVICSDMTDKSEASFKSESKVVIWMKNSEAYKDLIKIYSKAATDGFYYIPRLDWKTLNGMWTTNLSLSIPSYSSFLHQNLLKNGECVPDINKLEPNIFYSRMDLPFDELIMNCHIDYAKNNKLEINQCHPIYFYSHKQFNSYLTFRCIHNRGQLSMPKLDHFSSNNFCFEKYLEKINNK